MSAALRARVVKNLTKIISKGKSLTEVLDDFDSLEQGDRALARELIFGTLRQFYPLKAISQQLLNKPLKSKDDDIFCLILLGLYQIYFTRIPDHAVLSETVQAAVNLKKKWAKNLVNALLRRALRESEQLLTISNEKPYIAASLPKWLYQQLKNDWPEDYQSISQNSHQRAPLTLRVNRRHYHRDDYLKRLKKAGIEGSIHPYAEQAILLRESCNVSKLPGYKEGDFSVQDSAAQLAAQLLDVQPDQKILDACAAPGGKTAHILELTDNKAKVIALDSSASRLKRLEENLARLQLSATSLVANAIDTKAWFKGDSFDRILCDAPCSALGIIRRHPDIPLLRRESDIQTLNHTQQNLLNSLWKILKPGGIMLYATCSILRSENNDQISAFLSNHHDAKLMNSRLENENKESISDWQIFPGQDDMDGFYYAKLYKKD